MPAWHLGDLSPSGLLLTLLYAAIGFGCWRLERRSWNDRRISEEDRDRRRVWLVLAIAFLGIAIERQIGLFDRVTEVMRGDAVIDGAYGARRGRQAQTIEWLGIAILIAGPVLAFFAAQAGRWAAYLTLSAAVIVTFRVAKAVSLHQVDALFNRRLLGVALGNGAEGALAALAFGALLLERARRRERRAQARRGKRRRTRPK